MQIITNANPVPTEDAETLVQTSWACGMAQ